MIIRRIPSRLLRPYIKLLWASDEKEGEGIIRSSRERMIPTGNMHLVYRLSDHPIRIFESVDDSDGKTFPFGVIAGLRSGYYIKDVCRPLRTVGAILQPGTSRFLFGVTANELSGRHISIEYVWKQSSFDLLAQLHDAGTLRKQLNVFEAFLAHKLQPCGDIHPVVAFALNRISLNASIGEIVKETGFSHKHFIELFRTFVGLPPRLYSRIIRFQHALKMIKDGKGSWIDIALEASYSDQAHFNREFREFTGISPGEYRNSGSDNHHVPIPRGEMTSVGEGKFHSIR